MNGYGIIGRKPFRARKIVMRKCICDDRLEKLPTVASLSFSAIVYSACVPLAKQKHNCALCIIREMSSLASPNDGETICSLSVAA